MDTYIGIVLSGTNLTIGEMDVNGNILKMKRYVTSFFNQEAALKVMCDSIANYRDNVGYIGNPLAVGIGVIGRVDPVGGIWQQMTPTAPSPLHLLPRWAVLLGCRALSTTTLKDRHVP